MKDVKVQNIVASVSLDVELDLNSLAARIKNSEYNPTRFPDSSR